MSVRQIFLTNQICQFQLICQCLVGGHSTIDRLTILVCRPNKSVTLTNYFFKVAIIGRFLPLVGVIRRPVESRLTSATNVHNLYQWLILSIFVVLWNQPFKGEQYLVASMKGYSTYQRKSSLRSRHTLCGPISKFILE